VRRTSKATSAGSTRRQAEGRFARPSFASLLLALSLAACLAPVSALAGTAHEYKSSFGPDGTGATHFEFPGAVAVDEESHDVYVAELLGFGLSTVSKFDEDGTPVDFTAGPGAGTNDIDGFSFNPGEPGTSQIAVNSTSHDFYVADLGNAVIEAFHADGEEAEFTAGPGLGSNQIPAAGEPCGVAVDANGAIYMGVYGTGVRIFAPSGEELTTLSVLEPCNVAVDSHGVVYVARSVLTSAGAVEKFTPSVFPVTTATEYPPTGTVADPGAAFAIAVDPVSNELYVAKHPELEKSKIVQYNENGEVETEFGETGPGALKGSEGVAVDGATGKVYASDTAGERQVEVFFPPPPIPPSVVSTTATDITGTSADLQAQINPNSFDTHYHFEYLTEAEYQANGETFSGAQTTPETGLGSAAVPQTAQAHIGRLAPDTAYRFRVVAENENGETTSAEPAPGFATFPIFPPGLPDGRAYEMVSPPQKVGEVFPPFQDGFCSECLPGISAGMMPMQSTPNGEAVVYEGQPFSAGLASGPNEYLSRRSQSSGWGWQSLSSPLFASGVGQGFEAFSADLSRGVLFQIQPALSPEAPTQGGKLRQPLPAR
jgi:hypothetical protein